VSVKIINYVLTIPLAYLFSTYVYFMLSVNYISVIT